MSLWHITSIVLMCTHFTLAHTSVEIAPEANAYVGPVPELTVQQEKSRLE